MEEPRQRQCGEFVVRQEDARRLGTLIAALQERLAQVQHDLDHAVITPEKAGEETTRITQKLMRKLPASQSLELENSCQASGIDLHAMIDGSPIDRNAEVQHNGNVHHDK